MKLVSGGDPISTGGALYYPRKCEDCGYFWSDRQPLTVLRRVVAMPVRGVPWKPGEKLAPAPEAEEGGKPPLPFAGEDGEISPPAPEEAPANSEEAAGEVIVRVGEGFDPQKVSPGDVILFLDGKKERRLTVVSVAKKSVLGDVDGKPDRRIPKAKLLGRVEG
jgi:hypothetical protein